MKKAMSILLASTMAVSLAACSGSAASSTASSAAAFSGAEGAAVSEAAQASAENIKIAFFMYENSNTFTTYIRKGLEAYGAENGVTVESFDGKSDQSTQTDSITTALAKDEYDVVVVNPVDSGAGETINRLCEEKGIPVIYCDRAPDLVGGILDA